MIGTLNEWIQSARALVAKGPHIPLIDDHATKMDELWQMWLRGDDDLRAAIDNALARDPDDLPSRFVALNAYYRLANSWSPAGVTIGGSSGGVNTEETLLPARDPQEIREHLGYLVRLRDEDHCTDIRTIRWEIVNACAVNDHQRALALCQQLHNIITPPEHHYLTGRLHFLIIYLTHSWDPESLACWDLPIGPSPEGLRGIYQGANVLFLYMAGLKKIQSRESLTADEEDHLRDTIKHLERARTEYFPPSARFVLARSYSDVGDHHNSATAYQWMLDHHSDLFAACAKEAGPLWNSEITKGMLPSIHECLVNEYELDGEIDKAVAVATAWIAACPDQLGTYERRARLEQAKGDYRAAYEWLRKEVDRNPRWARTPT